MVRSSQTRRKASTARKVARSPARLFIKASPAWKMLARSSHIRPRSSSARPESQALTMKMGAMMAVYHMRATCRAKIHAVTE